MVEQASESDATLPPIEGVNKDFFMEFGNPDDPNSWLF